MFELKLCKNFEALFAFSSLHHAAIYNTFIGLPQQPESMAPNISSVETPLASINPCMQPGTHVLERLSTSKGENSNIRTYLEKNRKNLQNIRQSYIRRWTVVTSDGPHFLSSMYWRILISLPACNSID